VRPAIASNAKNSVDFIFAIGRALGNHAVRCYSTRVPCFAVPFRDASYPSTRVWRAASLRTATTSIDRRPSALELLIVPKWDVLKMCGNRHVSAHRQLREQAPRIMIRASSVSPKKQSRTITITFHGSHMSHSTLQANFTQLTVDPLDALIIKLFFSLAFACVLSGALMCVLNYGANTTVKMFGIEWSTTSAGIAIIAIGVFTAYLAVRIVLKNRREREVLRRNRRTAMRIARSKARRPNKASRKIRRRRALPKGVAAVSTAPETHPVS
jgi:hypothetical protein